MNKSELINQISLESGLNKADAVHALNATVATITDALSKNDSVQIIGFGTFLVRNRAARTGRNPQTGAQIQIKASKVAAFKAGRTLKEAVNKQISINK